MSPGKCLLTLAASLALLAGTARAQEPCGDCNADGSISVLDALKEAQIAVAILAPTGRDMELCDVDDDSDIDVIDALLTAQEAAGSGPGLSCPFTLTAATVTTGPLAGTNRVAISGGDTIELTGTGFTPALGVTIGGAAATITSLDRRTITVLAPAASGEMWVDVEISSPGGTPRTLTNALYYTGEADLSPYTGTFSREDAKHLYRRAAWGGTTAEIDAAVLVGLTATTAALVNYTNDPAIETAAEMEYGGVLPPRADLNTRTNKEWWLRLILENPNPLQDRLAWFFHDIFAISENDRSDDARWMIYNYVNLMRRASMDPGDTLGNGEPGLGYDWPKLVVEMTKDRMMLDWLDGRVSYVGRPNENYARELWELFTLGEGNGYTEADIQEAARAFTGFFWYRSGGSGTNSYLEMRYRPSRHDTTTKTIFGVTGRFGYDDVAPFYETYAGPSGMPEAGTTDPMQITDPVDLDGGVVALTFRERATEASQFICGRLAKFFLYDNVPAELVEELALELRTPGPNQWNLKPIILKILRSNAFYSGAARKSKYKNPMDFVIGFLRSTGLEIDLNPDVNGQRVRERLEALTQVVLDPPDVSGFPEDVSFVTTQGMQLRINFLNYVVTRQDDVNQLLAILPPRATLTSTVLADHLIDVLDIDIPYQVRISFIDYVDSQRIGGMITPVPFDPMNDDHVKMKTRGLLWLIGQYYVAHEK